MQHDLVSGDFLGIKTERAREPENVIWIPEASKESQIHWFFLTKKHFRKNCVFCILRLFSQKDSKDICFTNSGLNVFKFSAVRLKFSDTTLKHTVFPPKIPSNDVTLQV